VDWKARRLGTVTESTQQTSSLPPPFPHPLHSPTTTTTTTTTAAAAITNINKKSTTITDIDMKATSTSKSNPTSSSYPNFYTVFGSKSSAPSSVPILKEHSMENVNKNSVKSGEDTTNVDINLLNKSNINKNCNHNDSVKNIKIENCSKNEGDKLISEGHIDTKINDYYTHTHTHTPTLTLSSPHKSQRISPIILDNTSLMNILTERSLPKTNTNIENLKICGNIYDSETDDENADECNPVFCPNVHRYSNFDHNISTNVCEISSHFEKIDFSQSRNDIHNSNNNDVKVNNSSSDNNNNNSDNNNTQTRQYKSDGNSISVGGKDRSIDDKESIDKILCQKQEEKDSNNRAKKEEVGGEVEKGVEKGGESNLSDKLKTNEIKKSVILCDEKHSNDLMTFSGSNIITTSSSIQHNNNENNNNNDNNNEDNNENEKLENILFCSTVIESNDLHSPTNSQEKEKERDFMNDSNRQLSLPLLPSISGDEDINDKIQALRNEIDFNNNLNARSMRILVGKSVNKKENMKFNNNDGEICYKTVTDLIEYNTDIDSIPCDNFSEESSQLFTLPIIHNLSTFDIVSDSDCIALPLSLPSPILPSMTLFNRDQANTETTNELQKLKRFSIEKFSDMNYLEKNESKIFDDDENDNMVENENGSDNNVERDSGICPFAISSNDQTFPFVDIALSTYNVFDARTHVNDTTIENDGNDANNQENEKRSEKHLQSEQVLSQGQQKGKNEYSENRMLKIQLPEHNNVNNNTSVSGREINTIQNDYKNYYKNENENENEMLKNICSPNIHVQQYVKNKDENVLERSSVKVGGGDMTRLTSILTAFKTALKLKNVLFSLLLDKEQSQNSLNINIKQKNASGNIKSINQNSLKLDSNTSTASKSTSILNPENINEKILTHKTENMNMKMDKNYQNDQNTDDDNFASDINTKKIVKELIQFLSSKHMGSSLKFGDSQLATSSLSSFDFVEFFLFFLDIQVRNTVLHLIYLFL
jgi:hypothetical protein